VASWRREPERRSGTFVAYRQVGVGWPALWHPGPRTAPPRQTSARWHDERRLQIAQYLSLTTDGAWAELVRAEELRTRDERADYPRRLYRCTIEEHDIADLTDPAAHAGLDPELFTGPHEPCRALADELREAGCRGLLAPSAALPHATNLTLFGSRRELAGDEPNRRPDRYVRVLELADRALVPAHVLRITPRPAPPSRGRAPSTPPAAQ